MIVALAFRNGPIENLRAGKVCPACSADSAYSRISDEEMKGIMKAALNTVYSLLWKKENDGEAYAKSLVQGARYTERWDDPEFTVHSNGGDWLTAWHSPITVPDGIPHGANGFCFLPEPEQHAPLR